MRYTSLAPREQEEATGWQREFRFIRRAEDYERRPFNDTSKEAHIQRAAKIFSFHHHSTCLCIFSQFFFRLFEKF